VERWQRGNGAAPGKKIWPRITSETNLRRPNGLKPAGGRRSRFFQEVPKGWAVNAADTTFQNLWRRSGKIVRGQKNLILNRVCDQQREADGRTATLIRTIVFSWAYGIKAPDTHWDDFIRRFDPEGQSGAAFCPASPKPRTIRIFSRAKRLTYLRPVGLTNFEERRLRRGAGHADYSPPTTCELWLVSGAQLVGTGSGRYLKREKRKRRS